MCVSVCVDSLMCMCVCVCRDGVCVCECVCSGGDGVCLLIIRHYHTSNGL